MNVSNEPPVIVTAPPFTARSVKICTTPPIAESPYSDAPGPLDASTRRMAEDDTDDQSISPDSTSATGIPSSKRMYSASPPPKNPLAEATGRPA